MEIIARGAEAVIGVEGDVLYKQRVPKKYRIPVLDKKLRLYRTRREAKSLEKAYDLIPVPRLLGIDEIAPGLKMEYIQGDILRDVVSKINRVEVFRKLGENIKKIHDNDLIHGDLTTSNVILKDGIPYLIDFGLSFTSLKTEDKAVDIHLIRQALESKHYEEWEECFNALLEGYNPDEEFEERFAKVEGRGRYKHKQKA